MNEFEPIISKDQFYKFVDTQDKLIGKPGTAAHPYLVHVGSIAPFSLIIGHESGLIPDQLSHVKEFYEEYCNKFGRRTIHSRVKAVKSVRLKDCDFN